MAIKVKNIEVIDDNRNWQGLPITLSKIEQASAIDGQAIVWNSGRWIPGDVQLGKTEDWGLISSSPTSFADYGAIV